MYSDVSGYFYEVHVFRFSIQRVNNKRVPEQIFFRLVQYIAVCLFECNEAEDFSPAKTLMNMCFTFYSDSECSSLLYMLT